MSWFLGRAKQPRCEMAGRPRVTLVGTSEQTVAITDKVPPTSTTQRGLMAVQADEADLGTQVVHRWLLCRLPVVAVVQVHLALTESSTSVLQRPPAEPVAMVWYRRKVSSQTTPLPTVAVVEAARVRSMSPATRRGRRGPEARAAAAVVRRSVKVREQAAMDWRIPEAVAEVVPRPVAALRTLMTRRASEAKVLMAS